MNTFYELMETDSQKSHLVTNRKDAVVQEEPRKDGEMDSAED
jgi:hypothetical protein